MRVSEKITKEALLEQCAEECVELAHAALKLSRILRGENPTPASIENVIDNLNEEAADVLLCIDTLDEADIINKSLFIDIRKIKIDRWKNRLTEKEK